MGFQGIINLYVNAVDSDRIAGKNTVIKHLVKACYLIIIFENSGHLVYSHFSFPFSERCWSDLS